MNDTALIDSALPLLREHLEALWLAVEQPRALYARGSAISEYEPWDMDFVLFVGADGSKTACLAADTMTNIRLRLPSLPPPDISIVLDNHTSPEGLFALLLVAESSKLLFGEDNRQPVTFFQNHHHAIWQFALKTSISRLAAFEDCTSPTEQKKRAPHLAKSVLRLGGLMELQKCRFSRNPKECADWLGSAFPQSDEEIILLLRSLGTVVDPNGLANACRRIVIMVNKKFMND